MVKPDAPCRAGRPVPIFSVMTMQPPADRVPAVRFSPAHVSTMYGLSALTGIAVGRVLSAAEWLPASWLRVFVFLAVAGYPLALTAAWIRARREPSAEPAHGREVNTMPRSGWGALGFAALVAAAWIGLRGPGEAGPAGGASVSEPEPRVVVLPLLDLDRRADRTFADGVTDLLVDGLAGVEGLEVRGRVSAASFVDVNRDATTVGARLGGAAVVDGTVRRMPAGVRLSVRLLDTKTGAAVWTLSVDTTFGGLYGLRDEVVSGVAGALGLTVGERTLRRLERRRAPTDALDLYMLGRFRWAARIDGDLAEAISYYHLAIEADSGFTAAWTALAEGYAALPRFTRFPPRSAREYGAAAARTALQLDPDAAGAHTALGEILYVYEHDWEGARAHLQRAVELDPGDAAPRDRLCELELVRGDLPAAREACREARRRDPLAYRPGWLEAGIARAAGDVAASLRRLDSLVAAYPDFEPLAGERAVTHLLLADSAGTEADLAAWFALLAPASLADSLAATLAAARADGLAGLEVRAALARVADDLNPDPVQLAALMAQFGEEERAARMSAEALENRAPAALGLGVFPEFRRLRARADVTRALVAAGLPVS